MMMPSSLLDLSQSRELSVVSYILLLVAIFETINLRQQQAHDKMEQHYVLLPSAFPRDRLLPHIIYPGQ